MLQRISGDKVLEQELNVFLDGPQTGQTRRGLMAREQNGTRDGAQCSPWEDQSRALGEEGRTVKYQTQEDWSLII